MPTFTDPANIWMSSLICRLGAQTGKRKRPQQKASNNQQSGDESKRKWGIKEENKDSKQKQEASKSSSAMEQSKTNSELEKAQGTVVSEYELFRIDKIECNNKKMEELGIRKHEKSVPVRRRQDLKQRHHIPRQEDTMTNIWHLLTAHLHGITPSFNASKYLSSWEASYIVLTLGIQKVTTSTSH